MVNHGIDQDFYRIIENHYTNLNLCQRFSENSDDVISLLESNIKAAEGKLSLSDFRQIVLDTQRDIRRGHGLNYWKSILTETLVNNQQFMGRYKLA